MQAGGRTQTRELLVKWIIRLRAAAESRQANPPTAEPNQRLLCASDQGTPPVHQIQIRPQLLAAPSADRLRRDPSWSGHEELRHAGSSRDTPRRQSRVALEGTTSALPIGSCWRCAAWGFAARRPDPSTALRTRLIQSTCLDARPPHYISFRVSGTIVQAAVRRARGSRPATDRGVSARWRRQAAVPR